MRARRSRGVDGRRTRRRTSRRRGDRRRNGGRQCGRRRERAWVRASRVFDLNINILTDRRRIRRPSDPLFVAAGTRGRGQTNRPGDRCRAGRAPRLPTGHRRHVSQMRPGAVLVDIAIDRAGCFADSKPTTHDDPTFRVQCAVLLRGQHVPAPSRASTYALTNDHALPCSARRQGGRGLPNGSPRQGSFDAAGAICSTTRVAHDLDLPFTDRRSCSGSAQSWTADAGLVMIVAKRQPGQRPVSSPSATNSLQRRRFPDPSIAYAS